MGRATWTVGSGIRGVGSDRADETRPGEGNESYKGQQGGGAFLRARILSHLAQLPLLAKSSVRRGKLKPVMGASNSNLMCERFSKEGETQVIKYAVLSVQGNCEKMQDTFAAVADLDGTSSTSFFGVYDGHGGGEVAQYCAKQFHIELLQHQDYEQNPVNAVCSVFSRMDDLITKSNEWREVVNPGGCIPFLNNGIWPFNKECAYEGSAACTVLLKGTQIIIGNVGNSCCVVSKNDETIISITSPRPSNQDEAKRIRRAGGCVITTFWCIKNPHHRTGGVVALKYGDSVTLPISRSIGDSLFKQNKYLRPEEQMVTCEPSMKTVEVTADTDFILIASDGIWNCITYDRAASIVREQLRAGKSSLRAICEEIVDRCSRIYVLRDHMTIMIIQFKRIGSDDNDAGITKDDSQPDAAKGVKSANHTANTQGTNEGLTEPDDNDGESTSKTQCTADGELQLLLA